MNLELNLVKVESIHEQSAQILSRHRALVGNDTEAMAQIIEFLGRNIDIINAQITDKALVSKIEHLKNLTIDEFECLRWILAERGLDVQVWSISDVETGADGIPEGSIEYNVIDLTNYSSSFVPFCTKITFTQDEFKFSTLFEKISGMFGLFEGSLFEGRVNPILHDTRVMKSSEEVIGRVSPMLTEHVGSILSFLQKKIYTLYN